MNSNKHFTEHAQIRFQQRGMDKRVVNYLFEIGSKNRAAGGAWRYMFDHKARRRLKNIVNRTEYAQIEKQLNTYAIVSASDGVVVTLGRITRHIRR